MNVNGMLTYNLEVSLKNSLGTCLHEFWYCAWPSKAVNTFGKKKKRRQLILRCTLVRESSLMRQIERIKEFPRWLSNFSAPTCIATLPHFRPTLCYMCVCSSLSTPFSNSIKINEMLPTSLTLQLGYDALYSWTIFIWLSSNLLGFDPFSDDPSKQYVFFSNCRICDLLNGIMKSIDPNNR